MANFTFASKVSTLILIGSILMPAGAANAAYTMTAGGCYDTVAHAIVAASFCSGSPTASTTTTTVSTLPSVVNRSTTAQAVMTQIVTPNQGSSASNSTVSNHSGSYCEGSSYRGKKCQQYENNKLKKECKTAISPSNNIMASSDTRCTFYKDDGSEDTEKSCSTSSSANKDCRFGVVPSKGRFFVQNLFAGTGYSYTIINGSDSLLGTAHEMSTTGFAISSLWDFGDWGVAVSAPFRHTFNSNRYSALDNSQLGVTIAPTYHLFKEQVHGMSFDFGGRLGYNHTWFSDVGAVRNPSGSFGLGDFSDFNTFFGAINANFGKRIGSKTQINVGVDFSLYHNDDARSFVGNSGNMLFMSAGLSHNFSDQFILFGSVQGTNFRQNTFDSTALYSSLGAGAIFRINNRSTFTFNLNQSIAAPGFNTTAANLSYLIEWQ